MTSAKNAAVRYQRLNQPERLLQSPKEASLLQAAYTDLRDAYELMSLVRLCTAPFGLLACDIVNYFYRWQCCVSFMVDSVTCSACFCGRHPTPPCTMLMRLLT